MQELKQGLCGKTAEPVAKKRKMHTRLRMQPQQPLSKAEGQAETAEYTLHSATDTKAFVVGSRTWAHILQLLRGAP